MHPRFHQWLFVAAAVALACGARPAGAQATHPMDALTDAEIRGTVRILRDAGEAADGTVFPTITLHEMDKAAVRAWAPGDPIARAAEVVMRRDGETFESVVDLDARKVVSVRPVPGVQTAYAAPDWKSLARILNATPVWRAALAKRGIEHPERAVCTALAGGYFRDEPYHDRRIFRVVCAMPGGTHGDVVARPIGGLHAVVDVETGTVLDVVDTGVVPIAPEGGRGEAERPPLQPVVIASPGGGNVTYSGALQVAWQKWSFHVRMDGRTGPVLSLVRYRDGQRVRDVAYQLAMAEIFVPYMDPDPHWRFRAPLDAGEWRGLGYEAATLRAGADCPEQATFVSATLADEWGAPFQAERVICIFEEATGDPLWRHGGGGGSEANSRPAVQLVVRSIAQVDNYDYAVDWIFTQHAEIHVRVGATGIDQVKGVAARSMADPSAPADTAHGALVAPGIMAPWHDHYFGFRLDLDVDGPSNTLMRDAVTPVELPKDNPRRSIWVLASAPVRKEGPVAPLEHGGALRVVNETTPRGRLAHVPAYQVVPGGGALSVLDPDDDAQARGAFSAHRVWLTARKAEERYPAGDFPNLSPGGGGLPAYAADGDPVVGADLALWVTVGFRHLTRAEDWPIMPTRWYGFLIRPYNFFDESPAYDVPPEFAD